MIGKHVVRQACGISWTMQTVMLKQTAWLGDILCESHPPGGPGGPGGPAGGAGGLTALASTSKGDLCSSVGDGNAVAGIEGEETAVVSSSSGDVGLLGAPIEGTELGITSFMAAIVNKMLMVEDWRVG